LGTFVYNLRFPGQYYQAETGLNYNYSRDYDPQTGRYIESDSIGLKGGINTYAYVGSNPVSLRDPLGWCPNDDSHSWQNNLLNALFAPWGGYSDFLSDLQQTGWPGGSWDASLAALPMIGGAESAAATELEEMSEAALAEAQLEGRAFTSVSLGTNPLNLGANISAAEAEANLLSNGYSVTGATTTGGNVLFNGSNYYSFYTRTSTNSYGITTVRHVS
jgi:RHS repeat-associated protein